MYLEGHINQTTDIVQYAKKSYIVLMMKMVNFIAAFVVVDWGTKR